MITRPPRSLLTHTLFPSATLFPSGCPGSIWDATVHEFSNLGSPAALAAFGQVLMIDIMLAGDNAIVVGALAAGLPADQRRKVILIGIVEIGRASWRERVCQDV